MYSYGIRLQRDSGTSEKNWKHFGALHSPQADIKFDTIIHNHAGLCKMSQKEINIGLRCLVKTVEDQPKELVGSVLCHVKKG